MGPLDSVRPVRLTSLLRASAQCDAAATCDPCEWCLAHGSQTRRSPSNPSRNMYDSQRRSGESRPFWYEQTDVQEQPTSAWPDTPVDVAVVGAGITGLSTAYQLLKA